MKELFGKKYPPFRKRTSPGWRGLLTFALAASLMTSCVKDELYDTPHPDKGAVVVTADWSGKSAEAQVPEKYVLRIGTDEQTTGKETTVFDKLLAPGSYDLLAYNVPQGMTVDGTTATVSTLPDGTIEPNPGYLFSAAKAITVTADDTLRVTLPMEQRTRELTLTLRLAPGDENRLQSTAATLTGIVSAIDLVSGEAVGTEGGTVAPSFVLGMDDALVRSTGTPVLTATLRLLGIMPEERQVLALTVTMQDCYTTTLTSDLTEALKDFGKGELKPLELGAALEMPVDMHASGNISPWQETGDYEVDAQ